MPNKHAIWTVGDTPTPLVPDRLLSEQKLEDMIVADPSILSPDCMLIGRQEPTPFGGRIDLLAIAPDASLVLIELKRDRTPREVVAQALDYASWVEDLTPEKVAQIYQRFSSGGTLDEAFKALGEAPGRAPGRSVRACLGSFRMPALSRGFPVQSFHPSRGHIP